MNDMLESLEETVTTPAAKSGFVASKPPRNQPNPQKKANFHKLLTEESQRFKQVLLNREFQLSPFAALRGVISEQMK